ncbi:hypothetical protein CDAR_468341 [Caerostris darwini]|uniref:Uncharacterized protein n=1 Tax=Caerostris darwini TaxID=1538125 RepID=A0AAV4WWH5_9ARAC|nr:hypothetical protein CDAR_468341 [Caerostris darwini]
MRQQTTIASGGRGAILNRNTRREVKLSKSKAVARNRRTRSQMHPLGGNPFLSFPIPLSRTIITVVWSHFLVSNDCIKREGASSLREEVGSAI